MARSPASTGTDIDAASRQGRDRRLAGAPDAEDASSSKRVPRPDGAFYALMQLDTSLADIEIVERLIREFGVAVMPGSTFGTTTTCSLRVAYGALDRDTVATGMGRLVHGLQTILA